MSKREKKCCRPIVLASVVIVIGLIFVCLGGACIPLFEELYKDGVKKKLVMKEGGETYNDWVKPPVPVYMQYYLFNYTNVDDILNGSKPQVRQLGPYSYREVRYNYVLQRNSDEITYMQNYSYIFDSSTSCITCTENDVIHSPNIAAWTMLHLIGSIHVTNRSSPAKQFAVRMFNTVLTMQNVTPFHNLTVKKLLWGYEDKFLAFLQAHKDELDQVMKPLGLKPPPINPFVALQHNGSKEASYIGNLTLKTGNEDIDNLQRIFKWRGLSYSPYWNNDTFGQMINGTDGSHFKPFIDKSDKILYIFISDICRSLFLTYEGDQEIEDIKLRRFVLSADVFADKKTNPDNAPFCVKKCWKSGLLPVGQCLEGGPPAFMSQPHFYQADHTLMDAIVGLKPNKTLHQAFVDVDPVTGLTLRFHKRLQLNILVEIIPFITMTSNLRNSNTFLPVMYLDEKSKIDQPNIDKYKHDVVNPKDIMRYVRYGFWSLGGAMIIGGFIAYVYLKSKGHKYSKV